MPGVWFGAAYYHEYQPVPRLERDLDLMASAGFTVIRVGESVWSTWEPSSGVFELEWLAPVLDGAHRRGISVILGTPTYAVPPWLARLYPEIAGERAGGARIPWGARQEVDFTHPAFRFHAERVIRAIVQRYAGHPAVIGFQVDNEPGNELLHNHGVFQRFVDHLRSSYGDVETLNREWGLVYWSHRLSTWADLWLPDGNAQPQYDLAWRRFQAAQTASFIAWQAAIVREYASPAQFVTTCIAYDRPALDDRDLAGSLDVTSGNAYYVMQDGLARPDDRPAEQCWTTSGTWALYQTGDRMYSSKQAPFLVTETDAQSIGHSWNNRPAYDGQWRQAAWALISRGAEMIEYWHWHTLHFGAETYWGGVLPHSGEPGRAYREIARLGAELRAAGDAVTGLVPDAGVALIHSAPSKWAMQHQPPLATPDGGPDPRSYQRIFDAFYRGAFDAGGQCRIVHESQIPDTPLDGYPVLVAAGLYTADDATLDGLVAYAEGGGHLILGPRTGYADREARARAEIHPARLHRAAAVSYDEFSNIDGSIGVHGGEPLGLGPGAAATAWIDGLVPGGAEVLATYDHPHFGRWPAVTTQRCGAGRITCVGTVPNPALAAALFRWACPPPALECPQSVTFTSATNSRGDRVHFVHNWSWQSTELALPAPMAHVATGERTDQVALGPWDVQVLVG
jgi:beta-galactosidase